jgi:5-methylcytosine-specific restriction endonuclease McrA
MPRKDIVKYFHPWMFMRDKKRQRFAELRERDGDHCWRCRRPMQFDLPRGHEKAPTIEHRLPKSKGGTNALDNLCLCHGRCNWAMGDATPQVKERMRLRAEEAAVPKRRVAGGR